MFPLYIYICVGIYIYMYIYRALIPSFPAKNQGVLFPDEAQLSTGQG